MTHDGPAPLPKVGTGHYAALCGVSLGVIFLVQLQAGLLVLNLLCVLFGTFGLVTKWRLGPIPLVMLVATAQLSLQIGQGRYFGPGQLPRSMDLADVVLCAAVLGFVASHYRLQSIWYCLLPADPRRRAGLPRRVFPWLRKQARVVEEKRPADHITPQEIAWLVVTLPVWAVAAQVAWALIPKTWEALGIPTRLVQILVVLWLLTVGFFVVRTFLNFWKHRGHDAATAQLYLQDLLWRDTRGEQRRVNRWLAWWRLARKTQGD